MSQAMHFPVFEKANTKMDNTGPLRLLIKRLSEAFGPAGSEEMVRSLIREEIRSYADELRVDTLGNLIAKKRGTGNAPRSKIMLAAHMDEIGFIVTHVDQAGFCRFASLGQTVELALLGQRCLFGNGTVGVIGREKKRVKPREIEFDQFFIDVGTSNQGRAPVEVGDVASLHAEFVNQGERLIGKALDDRVGCVVLIETLRSMKKTPNDVWFVFTVQQQVGGRGARTSTYGLEPDLALALDVTETGDTPESTTMEVALGKGPAIKVKDPGILVSPAVRDVLLDAARQAKVQVQFEVVRQGASDAGAMQISREGTHAGAVSIPLRHMHTASEIVDWYDIENTIKLLVTLLSKPIAIPNSK